MAVTSGITYTNQISYTVFYVKWEQTSQSIANNETTINWKAGINTGTPSHHDIYYSNAVKIYNVYINGVLVSNGGTWSNITSSGDTDLLSGTLTIPHNEDGTKTFSVSISAWTYSSSNYSGSDSFELSSIPRQAIMISANDFNDEQNPSFTFTNNANATLSCWLEPNPSGPHYAERSLSGTSGTYTWELTENERNQLRSACSNANSCTCRIGLYSTLNGDTYASFLDKTLTIVNANPTITTKTYEDINPTTLAVTNNNQKIIQTLSTLQINLSTLKALKGATLSSIDVDINGNVVTQSLSGSSVGSKTINYGSVDVSQNIDAVVTIKDSRDNETSYNIPLTILEYFTPTAIINCYRDSNFYTTSVINVDANYPSLDSLNTINIKFRIKKTTDNTWGNWTSLSDSTDYTFNADNQYAWDLQVKLEDVFGTTKEYAINKVLDVGIPIVFYDIDRRSVGINCLPLGTGTIEVNGHNIEDLIPTELYNNASGSSGDITLNDDIDNYNFVEIYYKNGDGVYTSTKVDKTAWTNGSIALSFNVYNPAVSKFQMWGTDITISGTTLTHTNDYYFDVTSVTTINYISIYKVLGYK